LLKLVRYIYLNPLPARLVEHYNALCRYPYCAHSVIPGRRKKDFQDMEYILPLFNEKVATARRRYREFGQKGIAQGRRRAGYQSKPVSANAAYNTTGYQLGGKKGSKIG